METTHGIPQDGVGIGVGLMEVAKLYVYALVGHFGYRLMVKCDLVWWVKEK